MQTTHSTHHRHQTSPFRIHTILASVALALVLAAPQAASAEAAAVDAETKAGSQRPERIPITTDVPEVRALHDQGWRLLDSWRLDDALPIFERIVALDPDFPLGWVGLAWSQPRFKDMFAHGDTALALLDEADVSDGEELWVRGFHASINSDPESWRKHTEKLAELYPRDPRAITHLGNVYQGSLNDREGALRLYRKAIDLDPTFVLAWRGIGGIESVLGRPGEAEKAFRRFVDLAPDDPRAAADLAQHLLEQGELEEAVAEYGRALELSPLFEDAERGLVTVWMLQEEHQKAREHLHAIYEKAPHDGFRCGIHFALAVTYADEGRFDLAVEELEKNLALSAKIQDSLAMGIDLSNIVDMLVAAGRYDEAERRNQELVRFITGDPSQPQNRKRVTQATTHIRSGRIALHRGDLAQAKSESEAFRRAAEEIDRPWMHRFAHQLPAEIALAEQRWDDALRELHASNPNSAGNMYRIAHALKAKGDVDGYRRMLGYVVGYRGVLNLDYAKVRRQAERELQEATEG